MKELVRYLLENVYLDFQGEISLDTVRQFLRGDDSREANWPGSAGACTALRNMAPARGGGSTPSHMPCGVYNPQRRTNRVLAACASTA